MKKLIFALIAVIFLFPHITSAQAAPGCNPLIEICEPSVVSQEVPFFQPLAPTYCIQLFTNQYNFVNSALGQAATYKGILGLSMLIILMVFAILSIVYGIGMGFGIRKLQEFAKTEYIESAFNIFLIVLIAGATTFLGFVNYAPGSNAAPTGLAQTSAGTTPVQFGSGILGLYESSCNNIMNTQIWPSITNSIGILVNLVPYEILKGISIGYTPSGELSKILPGISFSPVAGLDVIYQLTVFELGTLAILLFVGLSIIFMLFIFYFLFPLFLYVGLLLRSFPWTRAAGGTLIALFVSFYIVFPILYYPFTGAAQASEIGQYICGSSQSTNPLCSAPNTFSGFFSNILSLLSQTANLLAFNSSSAGSLFILNMDIYIVYVAFVALKLIGLGIAFIVSYDLLEMLGDMLGSPSLQSSRLMSRLI